MLLSIVAPLISWYKIGAQFLTLTFSQLLLQPLCVCGVWTEVFCPEARLLVLPHNMERLMGLLDVRVEMMGSTF
jgi:hypothetical protein